MDRDTLQHHLDTFLETSAFSDYCPNGLQVEGKKDVHKVGFAVTASYEAIEAAADHKVDALIVHHGLFWKGDEFPVVGAKKRRLEKLLQAQINLFGYHLPLDSHPQVGNNWKAAIDLKLSDISSLMEIPGSKKNIGVIGSLSKPLDVESAVKMIEEYYNHKAHTALRFKKKEVERIAILSGGGYRYIPQAKAAGADLYITGNFDEPAWHLAVEEGLHFAALGHSATEVIGIRALQEWVEKSFGLETFFFKDENPF